MCIHRLKLIGVYVFSMGRRKGRNRFRHNFTLQPITIEYLRQFDNMSRTIDIAVQDLWKRNKRRKLL